MDEESEGIKSPWKIEEIPEQDHLYRQVHKKQSIDAKPRRFPSESAFVPDPDGLSVYWDKYISVKEIFLTIGISFAYGKQTFKDHTFFQIFRLQKKFLLSIDGISQVVHEPKYYGEPHPVGMPNIRAHSLVKYEDDVQIRVLLSDFCRDNINDCYCDFKVVAIKEEIEQLRQRA